MSNKRKAQAGFAGAPDSALSLKMQNCMKQIADGDGTITRYPGGFWYPAGNGKPSYGTTTVEALVTRGRLEYSEWKQSHGRQFPIKARMPPNDELKNGGQ